MAICVNFSPSEAKTLEAFSQLALGTHNATPDIIGAHLKIADPVAALEFKKVYDAYSTALRAQWDSTFRNGIPMPDAQKALDEKFAEFSALKTKHSNDPTLQWLSDPIHRKEFNVTPYPIDGKHAPPNPYLGATSAMDGIWPGYDKPEYFDQFPFLHEYEARMPGRAMQAFLREHRMLFHFPETVSRYGALFVPPPYLEDDMNVELRRHLSTCDKLYHTAPKLSPKTTVEEARLVLSYVEDDMVAVVEDEGGTCIGVIGWRDLEGQKPGQLVHTFMQKNWHEAPVEELPALKAFEYMEQRNWPYMIKFTEHGPRIVTQTTASVSHFLPPHTFKDGLGSAVYFGISDVREGDALVNRLITEADGIPAAIVETAHADTEYFRTILDHYRNRLQDVFLMAGTTIDPKAVIEFLNRYGADGVKLGIAEGRACRTSNTGIALPNAHVGLECGSVAYGRGYAMLDGWGNSDEFIKGIAMTGIQMRQGGGAFVGRREAASPTIVHDGIKGKYYRGMAGADVQQSVMGVKQPSLVKRAEARAHLHSEGAEVFVPQRSPSTVGRMLLAHMFLLKSAMSYEGVRAELDEGTLCTVEPVMRERVLHQFHRMARLYKVSA